MTIDKINTVITGNAREKLKELSAGSVNCIITSPPYWALRDYGIEPMIWDGDMNCEHKWEGVKGSSSRRKSEAEAQANIERAKERGYDKKQWGDDRSAIDDSQFCSLCGAWRGCLGLEPTIELYLKHLVGIFDEAKRVLRDDGVCFVNLGDTYAGSGRGGGGCFEKMCQSFRRDRELIPKSDYQVPGIPAKSLCLIPFRFAIEMVNHGWILRNTIIWSKPNPMPSSAKDRFTVDFEYVFFFSKKKKYWFNQQFEPYILPMNRWGGIYTDGNVEGSKYLKEDIDPAQLTQRPRSMRPNDSGRNKRTTWTIPTEAFPEAHFATFPCKLVEPMIKCGCPEFVCPKCGKARVKVWEKGNLVGKDRGGNYVGREIDPMVKKNPGTPGMQYEQTFKGYTSCSCGVGYEPGIVMDFFCGSGTVGKVAAYLRRNYILIDAKKEYCQMAEERIAEPESGVPVKEQRQGQQSLFEREE